jgi:hypothetical protein
MAINLRQLARSFIRSDKQKLIQLVTHQGIGQGVSGTTAPAPHHQIIKDPRPTAVLRSAPRRRSIAAGWLSPRFSRHSSSRYANGMRPIPGEPS